MSARPTRPTRPGDAPDFRALFEAAPGLYLVLAPDLTIVAASDAYLQATMTMRTEIVGRPLFDVFPDNPADPGATGVANLSASLERVLSERRSDTMAVQKYDIPKPDGSFEERHWSPVNSPVVDGDGNVIFIIHRVEDVTEYMRLREARAQEQSVAAALQTKTDAMGAEIHRRAQELQGANRELRELKNSLEARVAERTAELMRAHEQVRHSQKMEAIGQLAGGVAHDFNNLLTAIMGYAHLSARRVADNQAALKDIEEILRAAERATILTRQLLAFSRRDVVQPRVLDLNEVMQGVAGMLRRVVGEDVELILAPREGLWPVLADRGHMEQVIMNLVVNARDAMPEGGRLTIETANLELGDVYAGETVGLQAGEYVLLAVSDTGEGMDEATRARIFEPFFTTKGPERGTGLGLSTVYGIAHQWSGAIQVYSDVGWGSSFKVYLPRAAGSTETSRDTEALNEFPGGTETILVAEDQDPVAAVIVASLRICGYNVLLAPGGVDAVSMAERYNGTIALLLTDVVMPTIGGHELAERVKAARPNVKVLYVSGYSERGFSSQTLEASGAAFLAKPFSPMHLARKVREVLDGASSPLEERNRAAFEGRRP